MPSGPNGSSPSDEPPIGLSPAPSATPEGSLVSASADAAQEPGTNAQSTVGKPWDRVDTVLQRDFARERKAGKLSFERKMELYGEKLEEKFRELEERLLCRDEELLLKGRELQRLKAENYLLNCRVETISSPSKTAPRIFQTSPEHPNARIIITPPYAQKGRVSSSGDIFDPQLPSKPRKVSTSNNDDSSRRTSGRKRTATEKVYDYSSDTDSVIDEPKRRPAKAPRTNDAKDVTSPPQGESRRRKSSTKLIESTESTPKKKEEKEKSNSRTPSASKSVNREKEARLDRRENEELYEALQKQVTVDLLKRRGIPTNEQEEMVMDICRKLGLDTSTDLATRAATSVRYWVAHKSWRLRDHFKVLGSRYKSQHRNEDWSNALPPISAVKPMTNQKEVELWLFQSLGMRLATRRIMSNPQIRKALWIVFIGSLRYGIRAAYDGRITSPVFQTALESLDVFTKDFDYPVNETTGFRGKMKVIKGENEEEEEPDDDPLVGWEFDWNEVEEILKDQQ